MGIKGLLPQLRSITESIHISDYSGRRVAVDTYCWLHRGCVGCAEALCKGDDGSMAYVQFVKGRVRLLLDAGVKPLLVFDGAPLPAKRLQEVERANRREKCLAAARDLDASGNRAAALQMYRKAVDVTPTMAKRCIDELRITFGERVQVVVAPYEADAQLAWLSRSNHVYAVISEDSDLLPYGCNRVLFKFDKKGYGEQIVLENLGQSRELNLSRWDIPRFRLLCILSGCDYLPNIEGIGIKKAHRLVEQQHTAEKVIRRLRLEGNYSIPSDYVEGLKLAELTFRHQRVYDIVNECVCTLEPIDERFTECFGAGEFVGAPVDAALGKEIAEGRCDPVTCVPFPASESKPLTTVRVASRSRVKRTTSKRKSLSGVLSPPPKTKPISHYFMPVSKGSQRPFEMPRQSRPGPSVEERSDSQHSEPEVVVEAEQEADVQPRSSVQELLEEQQEQQEQTMKPYSLAARFKCKSKFISDTSQISVSRTFKAPAFDFERFRFRVSESGRERQTHPRHPRHCEKRDVPPPARPASKPAKVAAKPCLRPNNEAGPSFVHEHRVVPVREMPIDKSEPKANCSPEASAEASTTISVPNKNKEEPRSDSSTIPLCSTASAAVERSRVPPNMSITADLLLRQMTAKCVDSLDFYKYDGNDDDADETRVDNYIDSYDEQQ